MPRNKTGLLLKLIATSVLVPVVFLPAMMASCSVAPARKSEARTVPHEGDPVLVKKALALVDQGNLALARNDAVRAEQFGKQSVAVLPTFEGYYLLGMAARSLQKPEEALQALLKAETLRPDEEQLLLTLGLLYLVRGDSNSALNRFDRLLKKKPDDPVYNYRTGVIYKERKDYEKALEYLKKADRDGFEFRDQALLQLGDVCLELRRFDDADGYFARARKANPGMGDAETGSTASRTARLLDRGNAAFRKKDFVTAEAAYREAAGLNPESPIPWIQLGTVYLSRGDLKRAKDSFEQALKRKSDSKDARALLAATARKMGDYALSERLLEEGLKRSPEDPDLLNQLGLHQAALGEHEKAVIVFEKILKRHEAYLSARKNLIFQYIELSHFSDARRHLAIVQKAEPTNPEWKEADQIIQIQEILERGHALFRKGQYRRAEKEYGKALSLKKDYSPTIIALGNARMMLGDLKGAEHSFRAVRKTDPRNSAALEGLLAVYAKSGNQRERSALEREIQLMGQQYPEALLAFARQKEEEGKDKEAQIQYRGLLARLPGNAYILRRMAGIEIRAAIESNRRNKFEEAANHIAAAAKLDPSHPALARNRTIIEENRKYRHLVPEIEKAEAAFQKGDYARAEELFSKLQRQWPRPAFLVRLAEIRFETDREASGQSMLIEAMKKDPAGLEFREALYSRLLDRRQLNEAEEGFRKILTEDESAFFSSYKLGIIDILRRNYDDALEHLQQALLYRPDFLPARIARGVIYYEKGKSEDARREFEEARKVEDHGRELALLNIALMEWNAGSDRAEKSLKELSAIYPEFADPYYHLAYMAYARHQYDAALDHIDRALKIQRTPDSLYARIEILNKMKTAKELKDTARDFLKEFPGDERTGAVRRMVASIGGQKEFIQPALRYPTGQDTVYSLPASYLIVRADDVLGVERGTDRVRFQRKEKVKSHLLDRWLLLLLNDRLVWMDPESGEQVRSVSVPPGACAVTGDASSPVIVLAKDCGRGARSFRAVFGNQERQVPAGAVLVSAGTDHAKGRFALSDGNRVILLDGALRETGVEWKAPGALLRIRPIPPSSSEGESGRIVVQTAEKLFFLDGELKKVREVSLNGRSVVFDGFVLLVQDRSVDVLDNAGKTIQSFHLPSIPVRNDAIFPAGKDRLAFFEGNGDLVLVDPSGKIILRETVKKNEASIFRLYSTADNR